MVMNSAPNIAGLRMGTITCRIVAHRGRTRFILALKKGE